MIIEKIVEDILTYQEDNPHIVITENMINDLIEEYKEDIVKEIFKELEDKGGKTI